MGQKITLAWGLWGASWLCTICAATLAHGAFGLFTAAAIGLALSAVIFAIHELV